MPTTILLVRHGQTDSNLNGFYMGWSGEDLNEQGYTQAHSLSSRLASFSIASVYTSPLKRAYNTAMVIAKPHNLELKVLDDLIEMQLGDWQGLHINEIARQWPDLWRQWQTDPTDVTVPNGESFRQAMARIIRAYNTIVAANQGGQVLIVTHEVAVKVIAIHVLGAPSSIYRKFEIANASLSAIRIANGKTRLVTLNDTSHLKA